MSEHDYAVADLERTVDELRTHLMRMKEMWWEAQADRDHWRASAQVLAIQLGEPEMADREFERQRNNP
jgi:hypothetical protein